MEVEESSCQYLTINTHVGLFRYRRLPFGISTAPAIWQKAMSIVLQCCQKVVYYIDDILVTDQTRQEHEENVDRVFQRLEQFGLPSKCKFFQVFGPCHHARGNRRKGACNHSSCRAEEQEGVEVIFGVNDLQCQIPTQPCRCTSTLFPAEEG